jgi:histidyl-tRNA synthetase
MNINTSPPRGMRDILPRETEIRDFVIARILAIYRQYGFSHIETPALESIGLLTGGQGGENEKLIYKILKRGEKLDLDRRDITAEDLVDLGLRFDLTVPLTRYYANNRSNLPRVFKAIQLGSVWRAERPQRGRFRQFTQCDIDMIGVGSELCEAELLEATSEALVAVGFKDFTIRINDRKILSGMAAAAGFDAAAHDGVFITLDKLDKIGTDGVSAELAAAGHPAAAITSVMAMLDAMPRDATGLQAAAAALPESIDRGAFQALENVAKAVTAAADGRYTVEYDPTLVRGMGYYTGQIFEIQYGDYPFSIAGGGRYDRMIGRMIGTDVPACGFSIGFERVITILMEEGLADGDSGRRLAVIVADDDPLPAVLAAARALRADGYAATLLPRQRKLGRQIAGLADEGFDFFSVFRGDADRPEVEAVRKE